MPTQKLPLLTSAKARFFQIFAHQAVKCNQRRRSAVMRLVWTKLANFCVGSALSRNNIIARTASCRGALERTELIGSYPAPVASKKLIDALELSRSVSGASSAMASLNLQQLFLPIF